MCRRLIEAVEPRIALTVSFLPAVHSDVGSLGVATAGDFTGDGFADLVAKDTSTNQVHLYPGFGNGQFVQTATFFPLDAGANVVQLASADVNRDGKLDVVAVNARSASNTGGVSVMLGQGGLAFAPAQRYAAGPSPTSVAIGDFNRDGRLDLAVANDTAWPAASPNGSPTHGAGLLYGANSGFAPLRQLPLQGPTTAAAATPATPVLAASNALASPMLSFAGPNLLVATPIPVSTIYVVQSTIAASPSALPGVVAQVGAAGTNKGLAMADFNRDGRADVAALQTLGVVNNPFAVSVNSIVSGVAVSPNAPPTTTGYSNVGSFATGLSEAPQFGIAAADFDRDSRFDVAVAGLRPLGVVLPAFQTGVAVLPGKVGGMFAAAAFFTTRGSPTGLAIGDTDRDTRADIVTTSSLGASTLLNRSKHTPTTNAVVGGNDMTRVAELVDLTAL